MPTGYPLLAARPGPRCVERAGSEHPSSHPPHLKPRFQSARSGAILRASSRLCPVTLRQPEAEGLLSSESRQPCLLSGEVDLSVVVEVQGRPDGSAIAMQPCQVAGCVLNDPVDRRPADRSSPQMRRPAAPPRQAQQ